MAVYSLSVSVTQNQSAFLPDLPLVEEIALDPDALVIPAQPPQTVATNPDPRWHVREDDTQPAGVGIVMSQGQIAFRLTQMTSAATSATVTTGATDLQTDVASGPYRLQDSSIHWHNASLPATWGAAGEVVAKASLVAGDNNRIDVTISDGIMTVSHVDNGTETVDFTNPLNQPLPGRARSEPPTPWFNWIRIEGTVAGGFNVYGSVDGTVWLLLVAGTMSADMQGAFVASSLSFSMTSSGGSAVGSWVIGAINVAPVAAAWPGLYLQTEDQGGFAYNAGVWNQFGAPLDGSRPGYTWDSVNQRYQDPGGAPHYPSISALCYAADDYNTVYAVERNHAALFTSHDGGLSWSSQALPFARDAAHPGTDPLVPLSALSIFNLASPQTGEILLLGTAIDDTNQPGIYHSTNGGGAWTRIAALTPDPNPLVPPPPTRLLAAGGMRASSGKVWWAQQSNQSTAPPPSTSVPVPRYQALWSGSLNWLITIDDKPADQPVLVIPPLSTSHWHLPDTDPVTGLPTGTYTDGTAAMVLIFLSTPGIFTDTLVVDHPWVFSPEGYPPNLTVSEPRNQVMLWEDGYQDVWHSTSTGIEGIKGPLGYSGKAGPQLLWQPGTVSDADVATYWSMTDNMAERHRRIKAWNKATTPPATPEDPYPVPAPLPPDLTLPDMGGYQGTWIQASSLGENGEFPEPRNDRAGVFPDGLQYGAGALDYMHDIVTLTQPASSATVAAAYIPDFGPEGGKIHPTIYADPLRMSEPTEPPGGNSERKANLTMGGALSAVVVDVVPEDLELYLSMGLHLKLPHIELLTGLLRGYGTSAWAIDQSTGEAGFTHNSTAVAGPPGHEVEITYQRFEHPTWHYVEYPFLSLDGSVPTSVAITPYYVPPGAQAVGGLILAVQTVFGGGQLDVPAGWTALAPTAVSSTGVSGALGGRLPAYRRVPLGSRPAYGVYVQRAETGQWAGAYSAGGTLTGRINVREYDWGLVTYDLASMSQQVISVPFTYDPAAPLSVPLPALSTPYWIVPVGVGIQWLPDASAPPSISTTTWQVMRANFDGSAREVVGTLTFDDSTTGASPSALQIRPFSDDLCLVSSHWESNVWRVQAGSNPVPMWSTTLQQVATPWDAVALDDHTFIVVTNAVPPSPPPSLSP